MKLQSLTNIFLVTAIVIAQSLLVAIPTSASILTSATLTLTDHQASTSADQTIEFVTPSGVDASTDTIIVRHESGFTLSSLSSPGDFDLAVDNDSVCDGPFTDKTLAASAAAGTWGVGVSGQAITFTAPTDAGAGEIATGRCIQIQIGTVASGGTNQITNPGSSGSYEIDVYGTFGDHALYSVGIIAAGAHTVSATVGNSSTGSSTPTVDPPPGDTTAPIISNIVVSNITTNSATVTWDTNEPASSNFLYGLDTGYAETPIPDSAFRTSHSRLLTGLLEGTGYHFQITASDDSGNNASSTDQTFTTLDTTAPIISNLQVINITETTATVTWDTDELADSSVTGSFTTVSDSTLTLAHSLDLSGLTAGTLYPIDIFSSDASLNQATDSTSFTTLIDLPPTNAIGFIATPADSQVSLSWTNPPDLDFDHVSLRVSETGFPTNMTEGLEIYSGVNESFVHLGLVNGVEYFYTIFALDTALNVSSGASDSAIPVGPPAVLVISNMQVVGITQTTATVTWDTNIASDSTVTIDGVGVFENPTLTLSHSIDVSGLTVGTAYTATARSVDADSNVDFESMSFITATAGSVDISPTLLSILENTITNITQTSATAVWGTNLSADSVADVAGNAVYTDAGLVTSHSLGIIGLSPNTTYSVTITSSNGVESDSRVLDFTTLAEDELLVEEEVDETLEKEVILEEVVEPPALDTLIPRSEVSFLVARDAIELTPTINNDVQVLAGRRLAVNLNLVDAPADITSVQLSVGDSIFLMNPESSLVVDAGSNVVVVSNEQMYSSRIITPASSAPMLITINYITGEAQTIRYSLDVQSDGIVLDEATRNALSDATVSLYSGDSIWSAIPYAQTNPILTANDGLFSRYVPNGAYQVEVHRDGYSSVQTAHFGVNNNIVNTPIELVAVLPPIMEEIETVADVVPVLAKHAIQAVKVFRQNPDAQTTAKVAAPIVVVTAVSTITLLATSFNALRFLQYLFTAPFLLFKRRRRKKWGVVYDSLRKIPVDLAIVRLLDAETNRPVKTQVTDKEGRFLFVVDAGVYKIDVRKPGFTFPTVHLRDLKVDGDYLDLYHGEKIEVEEKDATIAVNIPMDPVGQEVTISKKSIIAKWFRRFMYAVSIIGVVVAIGVSVFDPSIWTITIAVVQIVVLAMFIKLAIPKKPKNWGIVYDEKSRRPLAKAIVRIFDPKFNKLLETQITDSRGRYAFLVGPSEYYTTYEKKGYGKIEVRPIDRTDTKDASYVSIDIPMEKNK